MLLSVVIITLNEAANIGRCIQSVQAVADEVIIVDSFSTDATVQIAREMGATIVLHPFKDYVDQKNFATGQATFDWVLSLDADEVLSDELCLSIQRIKETADPYPAYKLQRKTNYCGKWIKHCGWYPDKKVRLFDRTHGQWRGNRIHEQWKTDNSDARTGTLSGDLLHYSFNSVPDHLLKVQKYTTIMAAVIAEKGQPVSPFKIWLSPTFGFFQSYFLKTGFMDGYEGYLICKLSAYATHLKYKKAKAMTQASLLP